jgi:glyoxylase-like metal-dependent hydrolase (beta-lactamase superfamily II)
VSEAEKDNLEIVTIVNTHGHGDHTAGNATLKERTGARVFIHELDGDRYPDADVLLCNEKPLQLGDLAFDVIHTPGHTPGGICLHASKISSTYLFRSLPAAALKIVRIA